MLREGVKKKKKTKATFRKKGKILPKMLVGAYAPKCEVAARQLPATRLRYQGRWGTWTCRLQQHAAKQKVSTSG